VFVDVSAGGMQGSDCGSSVVVHQLKSSDGGILDPDDRLCDVVDDREQVPPHTHARSIDVKKVFLTFFYFPNVGKVQSDKQINKQHLRDNNNEIDL